jgi:alternate signal-mediated exported protein
MNKAMKGAIAAGAAGILLLGGAGTFALWSDSQDIDAGTVSTGQLSLTAATGTWTETDSETPIPNIATYQIVPGDSLTYTTVVTIKAEGENLKARLTVPSILEAPVTDDTNATVTDVNLDVDFQIDDEDVAGIKVDGNIVSFDEVATYAIPVSITVDFTDVPVNTDQNLNVDLTSALTFTLDQV